MYNSSKDHFRCYQIKTIYIFLFTRNRAILTPIIIVMKGRFYNIPDVPSNLDFEYSLFEIYYLFIFSNKINLINYLMIIDKISKLDKLIILNLKSL